DRLVARADAEPGLVRDDRRAAIDVGEQAQAVAQPPPANRARAAQRRLGVERPRRGHERLVYHAVVGSGAKLVSISSSAVAASASRAGPGANSSDGASTPTGPSAGSSRAASATAVHAAIAAAVAYTSAPRTITSSS